MVFYEKVIPVLILVCIVLFYIECDGKFKNVLKAMPSMFLFSIFYITISIVMFGWEPTLGATAMVYIPCHWFFLRQ